jgi:hypothetical protein
MFPSASSNDIELSLYLILCEYNPSGDVISKKRSEECVLSLIHGYGFDDVILII